MEPVRQDKFKTRSSLILYFLEGAKRYFLLSACFAVLVSLLDMVSPKIISFTVDQVIGSQALPERGFAAGFASIAGGIESLRDHPAWLAIWVAVLGVLAALCRYLFRSSNARGAERFVKRMRDGLYEQLSSLPYPWFASNSTGDLIQRCTSDVQTIKRFISEQMTALVRTIILLVMALAFLFSISLEAALLNAAFVPAVIGYSLYFHRHIANAFEKADIEEGKLSAIAQENLTGVRVVRAFGRERYERERFESQNTYYTGFWIHLYKLLSFFWASGDVLTGLQMLCVFVLGSVLCVHGSMTAGNFIAIVSYTIMLAWPIRMMGRVISEMSKAGISVDRLREIMNAQREEDPADCLPIPENGDITFSHVSFSYDASSAYNVLRDVSFTVPAGTTVGILGGTGSGKSTLVCLLERLYELPPENGSITIGGIDIRRFRRSDLRRYIGIVLQEPFLFSRTLEENIGIARDDPSAMPIEQAAIREAARAASIDDAIESFTDGYQTFVGERGVTLSGGQKQRTAIAQLLVRRTPVMVFDDSLSAVDAETDARIRSALPAYSRGATVFLIAHRITTLMHADQIIVLDQGQIAQIGSHEKLLREDGIYRRIFSLQAGIEE